MITVAVVDDDPLARTVLADMVRRQPDEFRVVAAVASVDPLLADPTAATPDVVILDVKLGPGNQLADNIERLSGLGARLLVVTCDIGRSEIVPALRRRTVSILDKDDLEDRLHDALRLTMAGTVVVAPAIQARLQAQTLPAPVFTPRQQEVFELLASGLPVKSVARRLGVGYKTAHDHVQEIHRRLRDAGWSIDGDLSLHYAAIELGYIADPRDSD